jgi:hypothetical protein
MGEKGKRKGAWFRGLSKTFSIIFCALVYLKVLSVPADVL